MSPMSAVIQRRLPADLPRRWRYSLVSVSCKHMPLCTCSVLAHQCCLVDTLVGIVIVCVYMYTAAMASFAAEELCGTCAVYKYSCNFGIVLFVCE